MSKTQIEQDIELAKKMICDNGLGLVAIKEGRVILKSGERGVRPFVQAINELGDTLHGSVIGDRVIGRASAMLCIYLGATAVYTPLISDSAVAEFRLADIKLVADKRTPYILNRQGTDMCPFEKMTEASRSPDEVFRTLAGFLGTSINN